MKKLDRCILSVFSVLILLEGVLISFFIFGWITLSDGVIFLSKVLANKVSCNVLIGLNVVLMLFAIKGIFFESDDEDERDTKDGILLENEDGKLLIAKETLNGIVASVVSEFTSVKSQKSKILLDDNNDVSIVLSIEVANDAVIKELSNNIQIRVKEAIKKSLDVEVKNLDIKIVNIIVPKEEIKE